MNQLMGVLRVVRYGDQSWIHDVEVPSTGSVGNNSEKIKGPLKQDRLNTCVKFSISYPNFLKNTKYKIVQ